jgi:hypothetical protein
METQSQLINEIAGALAKAQGEMETAVADSVNPHWKSKYADLASVWGACRVPLSKNGLSVVQTTKESDTGKCVVITTLMHSSGQWVKSVLSAMPIKNDPQGLGSCLTYLRRYSLAAMVGVSPEDDDGNGAGEKPKQVARTKEKQKYKNFEFLAAMTVLKKALSEELYYTMLGAEGYEHSNEIHPDKQKAIWMKLESKRKENCGKT